MEVSFLFKGRVNNVKELNDKLTELGIDIDYKMGVIGMVTDSDGKVIYQRSATETIQRKEYISGKTLRDGYYAFLIPLHEVDNNLLAYTNKQIPIYILQQLYYKLNNVNVNALTLTQKK